LAVKGETLMKKLFQVLTISLMSTIWYPAAAFDLLDDLKSNVQWRFGSAAQAGTAISMRSDDSTNVKAGQFIGSALASIVDYRFLNISAGGNFIPQANGTLKALDTGKIGINLGYLLKDFVNAPPDILKNMVIGPSLSTTIVTTPHVFIPFFDFTYSFSGTPVNPPPPPPPSAKEPPIL